MQSHAERTTAAKPFNLDYAHCLVRDQSLMSSPFPPSDAHLQRFSVEFEYPVLFVKGAFAPDAEHVAWAISRQSPATRHPVFVVLDGGLLEARGELRAAVERYVENQRALELRGVPFVLPGGEASKNDPALLAALQTRFAEARLDRHATVIVVGGGAVLDAAGYAASTVHRGLRVLRVPSTVLSQCDGGVGVKTGVNAFGAKNFLGTFAPPWAVINDLALLSTLPQRDARAGMAEAIKVALIRDASLFSWLEAHADALGRAEAVAVEELVRRCAALHLSHIARGGDPFEAGSARPLDYGHWSAHKLEITSGHELRHGEAVAIGMLLDARYAERTGRLSATDLGRIADLIARLGLPTSHPALTERAGGKLTVLKGLQDFREHLGGVLSITFLRGIGQAEEVHEVDEAVVEDAVGWLAERAGRA
jgi:3-dehydroquinate synthase